MPEQTFKAPYAGLSAMSTGRWALLVMPAAIWMRASVRWHAVSQSAELCERLCACSASDVGKRPESEARAGVENDVVADGAMLHWMQGRRGHYLGTEVEGAWYRRYRKRGWLARGLGEYWIEDETLHFRRYMTSTLLKIPLWQVKSVQLGSWHAGRWVAGKRAIKLVWQEQGTLLSSGFVLTRTAAAAVEQAEALRRLISGSQETPEGV
jgi:hypothetical protein